jgi:hypothetical protein
LLKKDMVNQRSGGGIIVAFGLPRGGNENVYAVAPHLVNRAAVLVVLYVVTLLRDKRSPRIGSIAAILVSRRGAYKGSDVEKAA